MISLVQPAPLATHGPSFPEWLEWAFIDWETFYSKSERCTITEGLYPYLYHPKFDPYRVTVRIYKGTTLLEVYTGDPRGFDWSKLDGRFLVAHNAAFDGPVTDRAVEMGIIPVSTPPAGLDQQSRWFCTADLAAYLQCDRALAGAVKGLYNVTLSKAMRNWMNGKTWADAVAAGKAKALDAYAQADGEWGSKIFLDHFHKWPEFETRLSLLTRKMGRRGVHADTALAASAKNTLQKVCWEAQQKIPWTKRVDPKTGDYYAPLSPQGLAAECAANGITPPETRRKDSEELEQWLEEHGSTYEFLAAMGQYQQANGHLQKIETLLNRIQPDGRMAYGLKYYGADTTGRWSGDAGFNTQNMPRKPKFGVDLRALFVPKPGHKFIISDLSQIEPRSLAWLSGDKAFLDLIRKGYNPYEAHAITTKAWTPKGKKLEEESPDMYSGMKVDVLGLGYGAGFEKVPDIAAIYKALDLLKVPVIPQDLDRFKAHVGKYSAEKLETIMSQSEEDITIYVNSWLKVQGFRENRPAIPALWRRLDNEFKKTKPGKDFVIRLPSGREMIYFDVRPPSAPGESWTACTERGGTRKRWFGAKLCENACQGMARDTFSFCLLALEDAGLIPVLQIHDEVVVEVPEADAVRLAEVVRQCMSTPPPYLAGFPLGCSIKITDRYQK